MKQSTTLWLLRHGETSWSLTGRHTGRTDVALTEKGARQAMALGMRLSEQPLDLILASPLTRAFETARLAGFEDRVTIDPDLQEWDYGAHEGRTTHDIRLDFPDWSVWDGPIPGGESIDDVAARADRVIDRAVANGGRVGLFAHGHFLRVLAARWLRLPPSSGGLVALDTASMSVLGTERERRVIRHWNEICHLPGE